MMPRKYRPRKEFKFWLYHDLAEDSRLMEFIQYCKATRQFARVVRDGIRLIWSLREGNNAVLFELFPHLERQFKPDAEELIEQFRQMLSQQLAAPNPPSLNSGRGLGGGVESPKSLASVKVALPLLDDDDSDDTIVLTHKTAAGNGSNILAGILGLE
jgi:hypothetical protein